MQPTIKKIPKNNLLLFGAIAALTVFSSFAPAQGTIPSPNWDVYPARPNGILPPIGRSGGFSPCGGATFAVRQALNNAKSSVLVQAYSFTSAPIAEALVRAHRRGVKVQVLLDKSQKTASSDDCQMQ